MNDASRVCTNNNLSGRRRWRRERENSSSSSLIMMRWAGENVGSLVSHHRRLHHEIKRLEGGRERGCAWTTFTPAAQQQNAVCRTCRNIGRRLIDSDDRRLAWSVPITFHHRPRTSSTWSRPAVKCLRSDLSCRSCSLQKFSSVKLRLHLQMAARSWKGLGTDRLHARFSIWRARIRRLQSESHQRAIHNSRATARTNASQKKRERNPASLLLRSKKKKKQQVLPRLVEHQRHTLFYTVPFQQINWASCKMDDVPRREIGKPLR